MIKALSLGTIALLSGCSMSSLPDACGQIGDVVKEQTKVFGAARAQVEAGAPVGRAMSTAVSLQPKWRRLADTCSAPVIAAGPDCLEFHELLQVHAGLDAVRSLSSLASEPQDRAFALGLLADLIREPSAQGKSCAARR